MAAGVGVSDLLLAPGLIAGRPRWPWAAGRAALNLGVAAYLLEVARHTGERRPRVAAQALLAVTGSDLLLAVDLARPDRP